MRLSRGKRQSIVIAGLGRCGTTLLSETLKRQGYRSPTSSFMDDFALLDGVKTGLVYKTHAYPPASLPADIKVVWLFGDPRDIALSVYKKMNDWGRRHHEHLQSPDFEPNTSVLRRDTLGLAAHFSAWQRPQNFPFLSVRYERLWDKKVQDAIADYLGFRIKLPPRQMRASDWQQSEFAETLDAVYGNLAVRIREAHDVQLWVR